MPKAAYRSDFCGKHKLLSAARLEPGPSRAAGKRVTTRPLRTDDDDDYYYYYLPLHAFRSSPVPFQAFCGSFVVQLISSKVDASFLQVVLR